jgi:site-specific recombinase XerD|tara:strand:+ start:303 stop:545 length:243 start_codon:yes stop_codon:yes gene_type:complete
MITNKNIKKDIVRKAILNDYIECCFQTGHQFSDVLGTTLNKFNYQVLLDRMRGMNDDDKFTFISKESMEWYQELIIKRKL